MSLKIKEKAIEHLNHIKSYLIKYFKQLNQQPLKQLIVFSIVITFILEMLNSHSIITGFASVIDNPIMFLFNALILFLTFSIANFFKRRNFLLVLIGSTWLIAGIVNFAVLGFRTTPFTGNDLRLLTSVLSIIPIYLNPIQIILVGILSVLIAASIVYAYIKFSKTPLQMRNALITLCCAIILLMGTSTLAEKTESVSDNFTNIAQAYQEYGFVYCFTNSIIDRGIDTPKTYSVEAVERVIEEFEEKENVPINGYSDNDSQNKLIRNVVSNLFQTLKIKYNDYQTLNNADTTATINEIPTQMKSQPPNIVMVQLESFFDVNYIKDYDYSSNPIPNFEYLRANYSSGFLTVPTIGAGTANTEFEVLSGMSLKYFGAGEYPYKTILKEKPVESICYNLDELEYHNHAIHNNTGTFYSRNKVYPNLGFDSFSSIEYMNDVEYNPLGWAKDNVIKDEILKALKATDQQDFVFAVSVQPHGKYPSVMIDEKQHITMTGDIDESEIAAYEYFINQLYETDYFVGSLVKELEKSDEPTILVLYGDHLPSMDLENEDLMNNDKFQTEYILWSNFPMKKVTKDLYAYQLNAYIMERLGYDNGVMTKLHQKSSTDADYQDQLVLLQYDMLYGDIATFAGEYPLKTKPMAMGTSKVKIDEIISKGEALFIHGENFTMWSAVYVDDEIRDTIFVDEETLIITNENLSEARKLFVAQVTAKNKILSQSNNWILEASEE
ncbi:MAG: sulfatase-like hydrolase/transferase [Clostridiales bacterium]|nr:sulfatase-like hydrolase/transferase [Clostridiales bacterium]